MRNKAILISLLLLLAAVQSYGQDFKRFKVSAWYSPSTSIQTRWYRACSPVFVHWDMHSEQTMSYIYSDYTSDVTSPGIFGAKFSYSIKKWFALQASIGFTPVSYSIFETIDHTATGKVSDCMICFIPEAKFTFLNKKWVRLYGSAGVGVCGYCSLRNSASVAIQFTPIGVEVGRSFFGFAELGIGHLHSGIQAGLGYKF